MRVLIQSRKNFYTLRGGDTVQLTKTKLELEKLGVNVDISLEYSPDLSNYDLVHVSNVTRIQETYLQVKNAVTQNKPIVLSTIFWPMDEFEKKGQIGIRKLINKHLNIDDEEKIKAIARFFYDKNSRDIATRNLWKIGYTKMQRYVLSSIDEFLPNSEIEMDKLSSHFNVRKNNYYVIPNAIDENIAYKKYKEATPPEFEKFRDAVICVGRIEPRKNQLSLVKALDGSNYKLILVGQVSKNQTNYFKQIQKFLEKNNEFTYIPHIDNDQLYQLYKVCRVSALPSWLDTPGLVSLEAGAMGCNLAISTRGSTKEYFKNYAYYCEPDDINSIRKAVDNAYNASKNEDLKNLILNNYTWKIAAEKTLEAYNAVLSKTKQ